jgi:hypothetical protein
MGTNHNVDARFVINPWQIIENNLRHFGYATRARTGRVHAAINQNYSGAIGCWKRNEERIAESDVVHSNADVARRSGDGVH